MVRHTLERKSSLIINMIGKLGALRFVLVGRNNGTINRGIKNAQKEQGVQKKQTFEKDLYC